VIEDGLAGRLAPEVLAGLGAVSRVSRALVGTGELPVLAGAALAEMREALGLELAALYLPDADGLPVLRRYVGDGAAEELSFDEEAWRLAVGGGAPIVLREAASWLVENPFSPPAHDWVILPLVTGEREMVGVVIASARERIAIDPLSGTVLTLLGLQLSAGITTARLRRELEHAAMERERRTVAAEVHDGLAQYLALALRELAMLESGASAGPERLREALTVAHRLVRSRLRDLTVGAPLGGLKAAVEEAAERARRRGLAVRVSGDAEVGPEAVTLVARVVSEALANAEAHAGAQAVDVRFAVADGRLELTVDDDGHGFDPHAAPGVGDGHLGLTVMRERARGYGGACVVESRPGAGTRVRLWIPVAG
jgi:nitrate/nitrite-specific signal transduction histidine kinase